MYLHKDHNNLSFGVVLIFGCEINGFDQRYVTYALRLPCPGWCLVLGDYRHLLHAVRVLVILILRKGYRNIDKFISKTIPAFAENNILTEGGVIFLPFQISFFSQIVANIKTLKKNYSIAFFGCTSKNTLWSCTQNISKAEIQQVDDKKNRSRRTVLHSNRTRNKRETLVKYMW